MGRLERAPHAWASVLAHGRACPSHPLQLSKSFLDPFGNGDSLTENFSIGCLLCETNAGSMRWLNAIDELPFATRGAGGNKPAA